MPFRLQVPDFQRKRVRQMKRLSPLPAEPATVATPAILSEIVTEQEPSTSVAATNTPRAQVRQVVTLCPICGNSYAQPLAAIPEWQPVSFRKQIEEARCAWLHRANMLSFSSAEREEYWRQ